MNGIDGECYIIIVTDGGQRVTAIKGNLRKFSLEFPSVDISAVRFADSIATEFTINEQRQTIKFEGELTQKEFTESFYLEDSK